MRRSLLLTALLLTGVCAACSDDGPLGPPRENAAGTYKLLTINETAMPFLLLTLTGYRLEVTSSTLTLATDSTYMESFVITETIQGTSGPVITVDTSVATGRWRHARDTVLTFVATDLSEQFDATFKNQRLSYTVMAGDSAFTFVYQKQ